MVTQYIKDRFGSKRGLLRACFFELARYLGCYSDFKKIDFQKVNRLIFVCNGNICRSPLGEAVAKFQSVDSASYGLDTRGDDHADPRALAFGAANNIIFTEHRTKKINKYQPSPNDLLVGMEPKHTSQLVALYGDMAQITLAGLWLEKPVVYLHDPYNTNAKFFNYCESLVEKSAKQLTVRVKETK